MQYAEAGNDMQAHSRTETNRNAFVTLQYAEAGEDMHAHSRTHSSYAQRTLYPGFIITVQSLQRFKR